MESKNIYVGNRYVPKVMGVWDPLISYEGLSIVLWEGNSFTSKKEVPVGTVLSNETYWDSTGNYNAQIELYRRDVKTVNDDLIVLSANHNEFKIATENELVSVNGLTTINKNEIEKQTNTLKILTSEVDNAKGSESTLALKLSKDQTKIALDLTGKIDKLGSGQVTYSNLSQDVRVALTGGAVAIVDDDSIITSNITKNAVTVDKVSSSVMGTSDNVLDLTTLMNGQYYGGFYSQSINVPVELKTVDVWNGSRNPIKVKKGDVVRFNKAIFGEYYIGVDDDLVIRQYGDVKDVVSEASVIVAEGVTGFYASIRDEYLSSTMITINTPMLSEYTPHKIPIKKKLDWLEVDFGNFTDEAKNELTGVGYFAGKTGNFLGDSITNGQYLPNKDLSFPSVMKNKLGLGMVNNYGINGSSISSFGSDSMVNRYSEMSNDADIIFFMGGRNDFGSSTDLFGDINTPATNKNTFYGALKNIAEGLKTKYPNKLIVFCTPPHGSSETIPETKPNPTTGKVYLDYVKAIREVANYYSLPVCDFWNNSGLQPLLTSDNENYFKQLDGTKDGVHPNELGHEKLALTACGFIKTLIY